MGADIHTKRGRIERWNKLKREDPESISLARLQELSFCGGDSAVYTPELEGSEAVALSVRKIDRDAVYSDGIVFKYKPTGSAAETSEEIDFLNSTQRLGLPIFVIFPNGEQTNQQTVRLAWVVDQDDKTGQLLILFDGKEIGYRGPKALGAALERFRSEPKGQQDETAQVRFWTDTIEKESDSSFVDWASRSTGPKFHPSIVEFHRAINGKNYIVLCGANNSGKTLSLKHLRIRFGMGSYMMGAQRFYHIPHISTQKVDPNLYAQYERQTFEQFSNEESNLESNFLDLGKVITNLKDSRRTDLFTLCEKLVGNKFELKRIDEEHELSMRYIDMDGQNLSVASTGIRLLMTMLGTCMDENFHTLLIDEPELGLGPAVQSQLCSFLANRDRRKRYFPHLRTVVVATHSHIFLDRGDITNNYLVKKAGNDITIEGVHSFHAFHNLQFNLLGNSLESMFLPSAFVLVDGKTDKAYLERCVQMQFPDRRVLLISTNGDPKKHMHTLRESLGDIYKSPYQGRIFAILDSVHSRGDPCALEKMGLPSDNVIVWRNNGIEYLYPPSLMAKVFGCAKDDLEDLSIDGDDVSLNRVHRKKSALCDEIVGMMTTETELPDELRSSFLDKLARAIN